MFFQRPAADLSAAEAAPQHRGHPGDLPPGPLLRPHQHAGACDHEVGGNLSSFCAHKISFDAGLTTAVTGRWSWT